MRLAFFQSPGWPLGVLVWQNHVLLARLHVQIILAIFQEILDSVVQSNQLIQRFLDPASVVLVIVEGVFSVDSLMAVMNRVVFVLSVARYGFNFFISASDRLIYCSVLVCTISQQLDRV